MSDDWPTFELPFEGLVVHGPRELARALVALGDRGYRAHVNEDDGFARSNYITLGVRRETRRHVEMLGEDADAYRCLRRVD